MTTNVTIPSKSLLKLDQYNEYESSTVIRVVVVGEEVLISKENTSQVSLCRAHSLKHQNKEANLLNAWLYLRFHEMNLN